MASRIRAFAAFRDRTCVDGTRAVAALYETATIRDGLNRSIGSRCCQTRHEGPAEKTEATRVRTPRRWETARPRQRDPWSSDGRCANGLLCRLAYGGGFSLASRPDRRHSRNRDNAPVETPSALCRAIQSAEISADGSGAHKRPHPREPLRLVCEILRPRLPYSKVTCKHA